MHLPSNEAAGGSDDHLGARLNSSSHGRRDAPGPLQCGHQIPDHDFLYFTQRSVSHNDPGAARNAKLERHVIFIVVWVFAVAKLVAVAARERGRRLLDVPLHPGIDAGIDAQEALDGLLQHLGGAAQVERPSRRVAHARVTEGVIAIDAPLVLDVDLRVGVVEQHLGLARPGGSRAQRFPMV